MTRPRPPRPSDPIYLLGRLVRYWGDGARTGARVGIVRASHRGRLTVQDLGGGRALSGTTDSVRHRGRRHGIDLDRVVSVHWRGRSIPVEAYLSARGAEE